jgi:D-tyrosyl-tRNA(Tyr) deacylase
MRIPGDVQGDVEVAMDRDHWESDRAWIIVVRSLKRAIAAIEQQAADLAAHLEVSVGTGHYCSYRPEPVAALSWIVEA